MNDCTAQAAPPRLAHAPSFDGLRAIAFLAVMLFHAGFLHVTGGFLGVTMFFTLSGFLITSLLLKELRVKNDVDLRGFWRRRVYRIMPILFVVAATWAVWGAFYGGVFGRQTIMGAVATFFFVTNWMVAQSPDSAGLVNGAWSVTVEEQFYLVWPIVLILLYRRFRSERTIAWIVVAAAVALAAHRWMLAPEWARIWFGTDTQADALLAGAAVALGFRCRSRLLAGVAGATLVGLLFLSVDAEMFTMRVAMPAAALCTALILPYLQENRTWLAWGPLAAVGRRSYGLYLWSAFIYLAKHTFELGPWWIIGAIALTFIVAEVTYRTVEVPMRRRGRPRPASAPPADEVKPVPLAA